tara:strand:+ start:487 stop:729 length:243 start_codon:yes stop_codon:yes gene_type:complete
LNKKIRIFHLLNIVDKSKPNKIKRNKINPDITEVAINFISKYGLLGALFAFPIWLFCGTLIFIGKIIKKRIHHISIKIKT